MAVIRLYDRICLSLSILFTVAGNTHTSSYHTFTQHTISKLNLITVNVKINTGSRNWSPHRWKHEESRYDSASEASEEPGEHGHVVLHVREGVWPCKGETRGDLQWLNPELGVSHYLHQPPILGPTCSQKAKWYIGCHPSVFLLVRGNTDQTQGDCWGLGTPRCLMDLLSVWLLSPRCPGCPSLCVSPPWSAGRFTQ